MSINLDKHRQVKSRFASSLGCHPFNYGTLASAKEELERLIEQHGGGAKLEWGTEPYEDQESLMVYTASPETDDEVRKRLKSEKNVAEYRLKFLKQNSVTKEIENLENKLKELEEL